MRNLILQSCKGNFVCVMKLEQKQGLFKLEIEWHFVFFQL